MNNLHPIAQAVQSQGRGKDTQLVHMTPGEVQGLHALAKAHGGSLSVNPETGLVEAGFLDSILPMVAGAGLMMIPGMQPMGAAMITGLGATMLNGGDLGKGLMAGMGAYGGAGLAGSLGVGAATTGTGLTAAAPVGNSATAGYNAGANAAGSGAVLPAGGFNLGPNAASSLNGGLTAGAQQSLTHSGLSTAQAATPSAYSFAPTATAMPVAPTVSALPASATGASQYSLSNTPSIMDKLSSGSFWGDNAMNIGAAAAPMLLQEPDTEDAPVDNEQYQYAYSPNRASQADLDAQRLANPGGELRHFNPTYGPRQIVRAAQGGLLGLAEGGAIGTPFGAVNPIFGPSMGAVASGPDNGGDEFKYTYDPATQTYKKVIPVADPVGGPTAAPSAPDISASPDAGVGGPSGGGNGGNGSAGGGIDSKAQGGIMGLAAGGMAQGGFVVAGDAVSAVGNGSTDAGIRKLVAMFGPSVKHIKGKGDGLSDSIPTNIDGKQPARVADGEAYIPPETVAKIGGGDPKKGAQKLYAMMDKIRSQAHGKTTQQRKVDPRKVV